MRTLDDIRNAYPDAAKATDKELLTELARRSGKDILDVATDFGVDIGQNNGDFTRGLRRGGQQLLGSAGGLVGLAAEFAGADSVKESALDYARRRFEQDELLSRDSDDVTNIDSFGGAADWAAGTLGQLVPMALSGGAAGIGGRLVGGAIARRGVAELGETAAAAAIKRGASRGMGAASVLQGIGEGSGALYADLVKEGKDEPLRALAFGAAGGALDAVPEIRALSRVFGGARAPGNLLSRVSREGAKQAGLESLTEVGQTALELQAKYEDLGSAESRNAFINAAAAGALGGGTIGALTGIPGRPKPPIADTRTDLLNPVAPPVEPAAPTLTTEFTPEVMGAAIDRFTGNAPPMTEAEREERRKQARENFSRQTVPTIIVDSNGVARVTTSEADIFEWKSRGSPRTKEQVAGSVPTLEELNEMFPGDPTLPAPPPTAAQGAINRLTGVNPPPRGKDREAQLRQEAGDLTAALGEQIDPQIVVDAAGRAYTTTSLAEVLDWQSRGSPSAGQVTAGGSTNAQANTAGRANADLIPAGSGGAGGLGTAGGAPTQPGPGTPPGGGTTVGSVEGADEQQPALTVERLKEQFGIKPNKRVNKQREAELGRLTALINMGAVSQEAVAERMGWAKAGRMGDVKQANDVDEQTFFGSMSPEQQVQFMIGQLPTEQQTILRMAADGVADVEIATQMGGKNKQWAQKKREEAIVSLMETAKRLGLSPDNIRAAMTAVPKTAAPSDTTRRASLDELTAQYAQEGLTDEQRADIEREIRIAQDTGPGMTSGDAANLGISTEPGARRSTGFQVVGAGADLGTLENAAQDPADLVEFGPADNTDLTDREVSEESGPLLAARATYESWRGASDPEWDDWGPEQKERWVKLDQALENMAISARWFDRAGVEILDEAEQGKFYSRRTGDTQGTTRAAIEAAVSKLTGGASWKVMVVENDTELPSDVRASMVDNGGTEAQAFVLGRRAYFVASRIEPGTEMGVFLHEVGVHLGMEGLIGRANMTALSAQVQTWAESGADTREATIARAALDRTTQAEGKADPEELLAYFVEEAVKAGVNPTADISGPLGAWFRTFWASIKAAMRKLSLMRVGEIDSKDIVNLAYGAARMEIVGTWHGTAQKYRKFDHRHMGTGEGAQAYGWGTYLAQGKGIADWYLNNDVRRKTKKIKPDGALLRVDVNVEMDKMLEYREPLWRQPEIMRLLDAAGVPYKENDSGETLYNRIQSSMEDDYKTGVLSLDRFIDTLPYDKLGTPQAASEFLDSIGIKGIKFLDDPSLSATTDPTVLMFDGVQYTKEELRRMRNSEDGLGPYSAMLRNMLANENIEDTKADFQEDVNNTAEMFYETALASAARRKVKVDPQAEREKAYASALETTYYGKQLTWLLENESKISIVAKKRRPDTNNLVIFNDKNIQRVNSWTAGDNKRIRFSKPAQATGVDAVVKGIMASPAARTAQAYGRKVNYSLLFGHQLVDRIGAMLPAARTFFRTLQDRITVRDRREARVMEVAGKFYKLDKAEQARANRFMHDSTTSQKWGYKPAWNSAAVVDAEMARQFAALTPEAQTAVKDVFAYGNETQREYEQVLLRTKGAEIEAQLVEAKASGDAKRIKAMEKEKASLLRENGALKSLLEGPYAPLKRFGRHAVVVKSQAFMDAEAAGATAQIEEMKADGNHYQVTFVESVYERERKVDELRAKFPDSNVVGFEREPERSVSTELPLQAIKRLQQAIVTGPNGEKLSERSKRLLSRMTSDLYVASLDSLSARQSQQRRRNIHGADEDMMRAFVSQGRGMAHMLATLEVNGPMQESLQTMRAQARTGRTAEKSDALNEVLNRYSLLMDTRPTPVQDAAMAMTSVWMLLTNPAYWFGNATQPFMMTLPVLSGRHGAGASWSTIMRAYSDMFGSLEGRALNPAKIRSVIGREGDAIQTLLDRGHIDLTLEREMGEISDGWNAGHKVMNKLRIIPQRIEVANRVASAVAAYRLEYTRAIRANATPAAAHEQATEYADTIVLDTHGDYSSAGAPRLLMQGATQMPIKLMGQFRKFQLIQLGLMSKLIRQSFGNDLTPGEKTAARYSLAWVLGTFATMTGIMGTIGVNFIWGILSQFGDEDEKDLDLVLTRELGSRDAAILLTRGVPALLGLDVSRRLGMGSVLSLFPYADTEPAVKDSYTNYVMAATGPFIGGLLPRAASGVDYINKGDYWKGLELLVPNGVTNLMRAARFETEGVTNTKGDQLLSPDEVGVMTDIFQGLGLPTTVLTERQWKSGVLYELEQQLRGDTTRIKKQFAEAARKRDSEAMAELRGEWRHMQEVRARNGLKTQPLSTLLKSGKEQSDREAMVEEGVALTSGNAGFVSTIPD